MLMIYLKMPDMGLAMGCTGTCKNLQRCTLQWIHKQFKHITF